jgi:hypothetical protein
MAKRRALLTPVDYGAAVDLSDQAPGTRRVYRKQVLPLGKRVTDPDSGRTWEFTAEYLTDLAEEFQKRERMVPFVLTDEDNRHTRRVDLLQGVVTSLDMAHDGEPAGLYATIEFADDDAAGPVRKSFGQLGVSARLIAEKGRNYVEHVAGTLRERVAGMHPWQAVSLSEDDAGRTVKVTDLTSADYEELEVAKPKSNPGAPPEPDGAQVDLSAASDEELLSYLDGQLDLSGDDEAPAGDVGQLDLAVAQLGQQRREMDQLQSQLAGERWRSERLALESDGVPPYLLDLADDVLSQRGAATLDLSDAPVSDALATARKAVRAMLEASRGVIDLSEPVGHQQGADGEESAEDKAATAWVSGIYGTER